ncbi:MAG: response regulator transcription factor [Microscillaceae bacterium]|nr:response regulator transcription factor [Microscillaceae bacterium]MDW8460626.1 response regulator transcription factor [Cytophagales bacterium]
MEIKTTQRILIVDDEPDIVELLQYNLIKAGYNVETATNGKEAIEMAKNFKPELILMDIMMPKMDGVEAARQIREIPEIQNCFIVFLTARVEEYSEVAAFDVGADDYIIKPIKPRALLSRIAALFRRERRNEKAHEKIVLGELIIDRESYSIEYKGTKHVLPKKEFELLYFLAKTPNKVYSREDLLQNIWGSEVYVLARTVDVHIRKLREKIGEDLIRTIKGVGYRMNI